MAISNSTDAVVNADANSHGTGNVLLETGGTPKLEVYNAGNVVISSGLVVNGRIQDQTGFIMPVGTILPYGGTVAPKGWLMCNGNNYNGTIYPDLYATIGTMFGNSGTAGYFNVPDLRGMFLRGAGTNNTYQTANGAYYAGGSVGTEMSDQMQGHYHQFNDLGHSHGITDNGHTHSYAFSTNDTTANTNNNNRILNSGAMSYGSYGWTSGSSKTNISINSAYTNCSIGIPTSDVTNGTPRTGAETRPASISVNYII
jgi:microcystin-dependent protein